MPKVSILVPTYNVEQYLVECMESIVNQTLKDIEIICIDDGSTDNSSKILDEYAAKDNRIKVIHKENGGYGKAMNVGLDNATGEYIGIVEPDDYVALDMYETLYNIAEENNLDFVKSDFYRFKGAGDNLELFYNKLSADDTFYNRVLTPNNEPKTYNFIMNTWCGIYKRTFLNKYNIMHNETPGASFQDNGFWFQTFMWAQRAYFLNKPFYMNRRDNPNSSVYDKSKIFQVLEEFDWIENLIYKNKKEECLDLFYLIKFNACTSGYKKVYIRRFRKNFKKIVENQHFNPKKFPEKRMYFLNLLINNPSKYYRLTTNKEKVIEKIFSIKNEPNRKKHKIITILGLKIKIKRKGK